MQVGQGKKRKEEQHRQRGERGTRKLKMEGKEEEVAVGREYWEGRLQKREKEKEE